MRTREPTIAGWGTAVLEEVLFRAASQLSKEHDDDVTVVDLVLGCRVRADVDRRCLMVEMASCVDGALVTSLAHPFAPMAP